MVLGRSALVVVASLFTALSACGGSTSKSTSPAPSAPPDNAAADDGDGTQKAATVDHGQVSDAYPAFTPEIGQITNNGGDVLASPVIVTVTWPNEALADQYEKFGDLIGHSAYWSTILGEYGVGPAASGPTNHVRMKEAMPTSMDANALDGIVSTNAQNAATSGWPAPTDQTIYVLYLPAGTSLILEGGADACDIGVGGYHDSTRITGADGNPLDVAYAILPQCRANALDDSTESASHEIAEAALDPHPSQNPGWVGFDDKHLAWEYFQQFQSENGDDCEFYRDSFYKNTTSDLPFSIQRQWSNKSALAGHAPCVPAPPGAYFNVTPLAQGTSRSISRSSKARRSSRRRASTSASAKRRASSWASTVTPRPTRGRSTPAKAAPSASANRRRATSTSSSTRRAAGTAKRRS
jgi:hypothetical protein